MSKFQDWYDQLPEQHKQYLEKQPIWHDRDLIKASIVGALVGFLLGIVVGYELGFQPVVNTFRPLVG